MAVQFSFWQTVAGVDVWRSNDGMAIAYEVRHASIDADGAPNAYAPDGAGLDLNANAGWPSGDWKNVLVADPNDPGRPYIQPEGGASPGFFVAMTSLRNPDKNIPDTSTEKYVDATRIPYFVYTSEFYNVKGTGGNGDFAFVWSATGTGSAAVMADVGGNDLGEISVHLAEKLSGSTANPRNGAGVPELPLRFVVFPRSRTRLVWPLTDEAIQATGKELLDGIGGSEALAGYWGKR
ncbi:Fungal chitosanase [Burkholderia pseudomallei]|nr:Fungal chitosanase [Burkholderia pseudomallei]CAJ5375481.1 Fungal chitosanase [Burkholderia pseudomallei]CAJ5628931.1 Fungal chitosanase [Burkholderia pseudomallei]CAJ9220743.1 Fungal chitosanase [Burkholderia pseudomallei]CAK0496267.1 Fungal chitosanase [Burkholderia pseudomallei]